MKVGVYARVSTVDKEQTPENQLQKIREFCNSRNFIIRKEYIDYASASNQNRPGFDELMNDARWHRFDAVVIVRLDRMMRSLINLLDVADKLKSWDVSIICIDQPIGSDTASERLMMQMLGAFAEFERELIRERVSDGMERAKRQGIHCGRPKRRIPMNVVKALQKEGKSVSEIARIMGIPRETLRRKIKGD